MYPFIYIFGKAIPTFGLCIVSGVLVAAYFLILTCKRENLCSENAIIIGVTGLGIGLLGAKMLYIFVTFKPSEILYILHNNSSLITDGGFVFYGGLLGGFLGAVLGAKIAKCNLCEYENNLILQIPLVHFFGRVGCFCAGCCYGKPTSSAFGVIYKNPIANTPTAIPLIPIQIYEALYNLIIFILLLLIKKKMDNKRILFPTYIILYATGRFFIEFFRYDYYRGVYFGLSTSQLISICLIIVGVTVLLCRKKKMWGVLD